MKYLNGTCARSLWDPTPLISLNRAVKRNPELASKETGSRVTLLHVAVILRRHRFVELLLSTDKSLVNKQDRRSAPRDSPPEMGIPHFLFMMHSSPPSESSNISFAPPTIPYDHVKDATPLHLACLVKDMDIAKLLLDAGADWNLKDSQGRKPEELIRDGDESHEGTKDAFARLRDEAEERRKLLEEESSEEDEKKPNESKKASRKKSLRDLLKGLPFMFDDSDSESSKSDTGDDSSNIPLGKHSYILL